MKHYDELMLAVEAGASIQQLQHLIRAALSELKASPPQKLEHFQNGRR